MCGDSHHSRYLLDGLLAGNAILRASNLSYDDCGGDQRSLRGARAGRPVDVAVYTDGSLLISDDLAGAVYRVTYAEPAAAPVTASSIMG